MRTYHWISLFKSYIETANQLIESKVILIANKRVKIIFYVCLNMIQRSFLFDYASTVKFFR
jgi:hypothetical protein